MDVNKKMLSEFGALDIRQGERMVLGGKGEEDSWELYIEVPTHILDKMRERLEESMQFTDIERSLGNVLSSLVAAKSLLIRADEMKKCPSKVVASDAIFAQMIKDYDKSISLGGKFLNAG